MNFQQYAAELSNTFIRNQEESERILKFIFKRIAQDVAEGKRIYFRGFGSFKKVRRPARKYRNLKTNKIEIRPAFSDIEFFPSKKIINSLKQKARSPRS